MVQPNGSSCSASYGSVSSIGGAKIHLYKLHMLKVALDLHVVTNLDNAVYHHWQVTNILGCCQYYS